MTQTAEQRAFMAQVRDRIAEVGNEHCDMRHWVSDGGAVRGAGPIDCGTTACIAGHALAIARGSFTHLDTLEGGFGYEAAKLLGVPPGLFGVTAWPDEYKAIAYDEGDAKGMLAILDAILDGLLDPETLTGTVF